MTEQKRLSPGDQAPEFTLPDSQGNNVSLSDFRGRWVVVYFYPAAGTPGCTKQACDFRDNLALLDDSGYQVLGISPDKQSKLAKFAADQGLTFPLLSDSDKTVLTEWAAFGEKKNYGRVVQGVIRSTFVVDPEGRISKALYNVRATGHVARLLKDLDLAE
ncbi:Peroxiredoxin [Saccharomonospora marina XMU15]|uniref:thioredoxin-dependent peroxiredoxin n=1 Tax=Saccharomonospora marina XMU15 TaxID=882083 RepID=H5X4X1_9PSEU|nr:thioredoxin-dependent thiol peroxidase [Saccharomonospora marina]EHR52250.1 Peroxiredoxin [Saccharomonospora marina XMU15]